MNITVGIGCLVALAVLGGITGLSEQHFGIEDQGEVLDMKSELLGNPFERRRGKSFCRRKLRGRCVKRRKRCPGHLSAQTSPGRPYCGKFHRCCHPGCEFGGQFYPNGAMIQGTCMKLKCIGGRIWKYTGNIDQECGECQLYGDPHIFTYDNHTSQGIDKYYRFMDPGIFIVTQSGLDIPAEYGLSASMEKCFESETCVRSINYFEPGIEINITLPTFNYTNDADEGTSHCYSDHPSDDPECAIKVYVNGEEHTLDGSVESVYGDDGTVLLFPHNHYGNSDVPYRPFVKGQDTICINIVGSKGLSMSLCMSTLLWYSNMYVWASPTLRGELYGLCDTYTGAVRDGYTMQNGSLTYNYTDLFGSTWKTLENEQSPGTSVDKCINATVLAEIQELCDDITEDVCEIIPPWQCAGFIAACVYDLCRTFNIDLQAQAYANHFLIHGHLHQ